MDFAKLEQAARGEVTTAKVEADKALAWGGVHPGLTLIIGIALGLLVAVVV